MGPPGGGGVRLLYWMTGFWCVAPMRRGGRYVRAYVGEKRGVADDLFARLRREMGETLLYAGFILMVFGILLYFPALGPLPQIVRIVFGALFCGTAIPIYLAYTHKTVLDAFLERERLLDGPCQPDGAPYNFTVEMQKATFSDRENFLNEFRSVPKTAKNVVLVLRQSRKKLWYGKPPYTVESMIRQLQRRKDDARASEIGIAWVCIENKYKTFEAYLSYARFESDVMHCRNPAYADLLSTGDLEEFRRKLQDHKDGEADLKKACVVKPNTIVGLSEDHLPATATRREVLSRLAASGKSEVMLVSDDRKRLGMLTLGNLVKTIFINFLLNKDEELSFERRIREWSEQCRQRVADLEAVEIQPPPAATGDEQPDYDTMVPADMGRWRGTGDLRFRQP
jgi:hypothetical protein